MKTTIHSAVGALALTALLAGQALAQSDASPGSALGADRATHPTFSALDVDRDGVLSLAEAGGSKGLLSEWVRADANSDGYVDRSEFAAFETGPDFSPHSQGAPEMDPGVPSDGPMR